MRNIRQLLVAFLMSAVVACGGGGTLGDSGNPTTPVYTVSASISPSTNLSQNNSLTVKVTVVASSGSASGQLVTFTLSDAELATFSNQAGTALTDATGVATIQLVVGNKSGAGTVTASLAGGQKAEIGFTSEGKPTIGDVLTLSTELLTATSVDPAKSCGAREVSRNCKPQVRVKLTSAQGKSVQNKQVRLTIPAADVNKALFTGGTSTVTLSMGQDGTALASLQVGTEANDGAIEARVVDDQSVAPALNSFSSKGDYYSVRLLANKLLLGSGNADPVELSALVRDPGNVVAKDVKVDFSTDSSSEIEVVSALTSASGIATARLSSKSSAEVRKVIATASLNKNVSASLDISVFGSRMDIQSPDSVVLNAQPEIVVSLLDSVSNPVSNESVTLTVTGGSLLRGASGTGPTITEMVDASGKVKVNLLATVAGTAELIVGALNNSVTNKTSIRINSDAFNFTPVTSAVTEIDIDATGAGTAMTVLWQSNNANVVGENVRFVSNRGVLLADDSAIPDYNNVSPANVLTGSNGLATVFGRSKYSGLATIEATALQNGAPIATATKQIEYVSTNPTKIEVQASPTRVGVGESSAIRAIVRDALNNPVKNANIIFQIQNASGGRLNPVEAITDSQGVAVTEFIADQTTGANTGDTLNVGAYVRTKPAVTGNTPLVVGKRTLFFRIGTGNLITIASDSTYEKEFTAIVTDAAGNPVANQLLNVSIVPLGYAYGMWIPTYKEGTTTFLYYSPVPSSYCESEDANYNGILDEGEDRDLGEIRPGLGDGKLTPGNVATVISAVAGQTEIRSDARGEAKFRVLYPQAYAGWVQTNLIVSDKADGTENVTSQTYVLSAASEHTTDEQNPPTRNPFGVTGSCKTRAGWY